MAQAEMRSEHSCVSLNSTMKGVPAFLRSLYHMVDDEKNNLIHWADDGDSFFIKEHDRFAKEVLGEWFKHTNYSSFVRQLNNYGFHKLVHLRQGALRSNGAHEYHNYIHPDFRRDRQDLLGRIQRKGQSTSDEPIKSPEVHSRTSVKKEDLTMAEVTPAEDFSQNRLVDAILLEVEGLKRRQNEQDRENQVLRDSLDVVKANMARHQDVILRLLACLGLIPTADYNSATRGHNYLMIQGVKESEGSEKAEISAPDGNCAIFSSLSDSRPTVTEIHDGGDHTNASQQSSPVSTGGSPSPPPSPSSSVVDSNQPASHLGFIFGEDTALATCGGSEISDFSADLMDYSLSSSQSDHLYDANTFPYSLIESQFIDSAGETAADLDPIYGMNTIDPGTFPDFPLPHSLGSSNGSSTTSNTILKPGATSSIHITTDMATTSVAPSDSTLTPASAKGIKRKKHLMDESRTDCASHPPVSSPSLHDTQSTNLFRQTASLPPKNELTQDTTMRSTQPNVNFTFDMSTILSPSGDENRSPKRARSTSVSRGYDF